MSNSINTAASSVSFEDIAKYLRGEPGKDVEAQKQFDQLDNRSDKTSIGTITNEEFFNNFGSKFGFSREESDKYLAKYNTDGKPGLSLDEYKKLYQGGCPEFCVNGA